MMPMMKMKLGYHFLFVATREAKVVIGNKEGGPFGVVIVKNGDIITQAHNEVLKTKDPITHA
jgi:tRNA(Arg) A34 adenosine deaminase TadA